MFIGKSCPVILHQSFITYVNRNIMPVIHHLSFITYVYRNIGPHHHSSIIHTICSSEYHAQSSFINHSYHVFIGLACPVILHQSYITYVYRNMITHHPPITIHTLCSSEYHAPSSVTNHSYPMFIGISCPSSFINHSYHMFIGISCPVIVHQSFIPYVYRNIKLRHHSSIIYTLR